jgi:hypothetical protein
VNRPNREQRRLERSNDLLYNRIRYEKDCYYQQQIPVDGFLVHQVDSDNIRPDPDRYDDYLKGRFKDHDFLEGTWVDAFGVELKPTNYEEQAERQEVFNNFIRTLNDTPVEFDLDSKPLAKVVEQILENERASLIETQKRQFKAGLTTEDRIGYQTITESVPNTIKTPSEEYSIASMETLHSQDKIVEPMKLNYTHLLLNTVEVRARDYSMKITGYRKYNHINHDWIDEFGNKRTCKSVISSVELRDLCHFHSKAPFVDSRHSTSPVDGKLNLEGSSPNFTTKPSRRAIDERICRWFDVTIIGRPTIYVSKERLRFYRGLPYDPGFHKLLDLM